MLTTERRYILPKLLEEPLGTRSDISKRERLSYEIVKQYFLRKEGIELARPSRTPCDLASADGKVFVEVKSIKEQYWNMGPISDKGHRLAKESLKGQFRYEVHLVRFVDEDKVAFHYVMPARDVLKYTTPERKWFFTRDPRIEPPKHMVERLNMDHWH